MVIGCWASNSPVTEKIILVTSDSVNNTNKRDTMCLPQGSPRGVLPQRQAQCLTRIVESPFHQTPAAQPVLILTGSSRFRRIPRQTCFVAALERQLWVPVQESRSKPGLSPERVPLCARNTCGGHGMVLALCAHNVFVHKVDSVTWSSSSAKISRFQHVRTDIWLHVRVGIALNQVCCGI